MAKIQVFNKLAKLEDLYINNYDKGRFFGYCKECNSYNNNYSCPPFDEETDNLLDSYDFMNIFVIKIIFSSDEIKENIGKKKIIEYTTNILTPVKQKAHDGLIGFEKEYDHTLYLGMGSCKICDECERKYGRECIYPERVRPSPESLGFDITGILKDCFDIEIKWSKDSLPEYYTLLSGLLSKNYIEIPDIEIERIENSLNVF